MKPGRRVNPLRWAWILLCSVGVTLYISVIAIWKATRGTLTREFADDTLRWWARKLTHYIDLHYVLHNPHGFTFEPGRAYILMCNHASHYDIPLTFAALDGSIRMVAKKELFRVPVWGRGLRLAEFIAIDRANREQALKDLDRAREKMESGVIIWIAPEGTRSRSGKLQPFKKGGFMLALDTGATIVPLGIRGARNVLPPDTTSVFVGCEVDLHIGRPIDASTYSLETRDALMEEVERQLLELADLEKLEPEPARPN